MAPANDKTAAGPRRRIKYTEQPFPQDETTTKAQVNQQPQSSLFKVPRELRKRVFDLTFRNTLDSIDISALFYRDDDNMPSSDAGAIAPPSTALILTCRRIFEECKSTFDSASRTYWQKDFVINVQEQPNISRSLNWVPDEFVAHIRKYKVEVSFRGAHAAITLRAKTDGCWYLDAFRQPDSSEEHLATLEASLRERLDGLQAPEDVRKSFQRGRSSDGDTFKAFTGDGLRALLL